MQNRNAIYPHHCPHCGHKWMGIKKHVVACVSCKERLDQPNRVPGKQAALQYIEGVLITRQGFSPTKARKEASSVLKSLNYIYRR